MPRREPLMIRSDGYLLPGEIWEPGEAGSSVALVLCHGSTLKGMRHELIRYLAQALSARWPVLAFDLPGFGRAPRLVVRGTEDYLYYRHVLAAAELARELTGLKTVLIGHSMGGRVSLQAAAEGQHSGLVAGVVTLAGLYQLPGNPEEMAKLVADFASFAKVRFEVPMDEVAREVAELNPTRRAVEALEIPLLAVEAGKEQYGFIRETRYELFRAAKCPKMLVLLGQADHKFKGCWELVAKLVSGWLENTFRE